MKKQFTVISLACLLTAGAIFTSCNKDEETPAQEVAVEDNTEGTAEEDEVANMTEVAMSGNDGSMRTDGTTGTAQDLPCGAAVTINKIAGTTGGTLTIDFGATNKACEGKNRRGKIIVVYSNRYLVAGATQTITFDNYYVNDKKVEGQLVRKNLSSPSTGVYTVELTAANFKITAPDGRFASLSGVRTRNWNTKSTLTANDDEYSITGSVTGVSRDGVSYTATIVRPLVLTFNCLPTSGGVPVSGVLEVTPAGVATRNVNYGTGSCDRVVTVSVGNFTADIIVK